jgi:hypothetical protein
MTDLPDNCPVECPNRRGDGLNVFGLHLDPIELLLQSAMIICLLYPAARASAQEDFGIEEGVKWMGAIAGACTLIRLSPTDRINAYLKVTGKG